MSVPSIEIIEEFDTETLIAFLREQKKLQLSETHFNVLRNKEVAGYDFLSLKQVELERYGLQPGPAKRIADFINELNIKQPGPAKRIADFINELNIQYNDVQKNYEDIIKKIKSYVNSPCSTPPHVSNENISFTTSTVTTVQEVGNRFKFVEREEQMRLYRELVLNAFEIWQTYHTKGAYSKHDYKKSLIIPVIGGASGIGKTRFLNEIVRWMNYRVDYANSPHPNNETTDEQKARECLQKIYQRNLVLYIEVNNLLFKNDQICLENLTEMLIMAYMNRVGSIDNETLKEIQSVLKHSDPFERVANILYELESTDKELPIIFLIHMDETQIL
ncbi:8266_t:CDS:2 [Funneliformis geosporum]|uniref:15617_t:CDS:1 n=1 Tax=Funneliformis geosporum TaxID=1117311 RepID=A0A9W4WPX9_9GLOM|nr:15617_t:CDS:2 [Funneliformis geosporum]CAI2182112.1 8266_t:CDS:2 [Funneliformis geosporum]